MFPFVPEIDLLGFLLYTQPYEEPTYLFLSFPQTHHLLYGVGGTGITFGLSGLC